MNRKLNFQKITKTNPNLGNYIRSKYRLLRFNEELQDIREEDELNLQINIRNYLENTNRIKYIL